MDTLNKTGAMRCKQTNSVESANHVNSSVPSEHTTMRNQCIQQTAAETNIIKYVTISHFTVIAVVEFPGNVECVVRDEGERRVRVRVVPQLLQLEHVHGPVQRHFGAW